ncbi:hypothetical protein ABZ588_01590 [Streptomyces althioticus]|uniref:Uncharacterized protein n=1 Tax=Streptomyces griseorubens TaxID=66897 RepID=A0ABR4T5T5_9ACTN|nr:hypothetical protein ASR50_12210 [Streptomyces sp. 4F]KEG42326.1 hypothetical protein DJ64_32750 [Streptomyces griseorubens]
MHNALVSHDYRSGDVLSLECPFTETAVTGVTRYYVSVRWPWWEVDPQAENIRWNGERALPTPAAHEWEVFRTEPAETALKPGDTCLVGIPATVVHVQAVHRFDPPLVTGMLPRPASYLEVLRRGETHDPCLEDQGCTIDPVGGEPLRIELVFRPYAFLEPGDEVADRDGRAWRFDAAWNWCPFDGEQSGTPAWPLTLLFRRGEPTPKETEEVTRATSAGSHADELERWSELTRARPTTQQQ